MPESIIMCGRLVTELVWPGTCGQVLMRGGVGRGYMRGLNCKVSQISLKVGDSIPSATGDCTLYY